MGKGNKSFFGVPRVLTHIELRDPHENKQLFCFPCADSKNLNIFFFSSMVNRSTIDLQTPYLWSPRPPA